MTRQPFERLSARRDNLEPCRQRRRGAVAVIAAVLMVVVFTFLAFAIDLGCVAVARTSLQRAIDSSALAGASAIAEGVTAARAEALRFAQANDVGSRPVDESEVQIEFGVWSEDSRTFTPQEENASAVRLSARLDNFPLFFARVLGTQETSIAAQAIAVHQPRDVVIALDCSGSMNDDSELRSISTMGQAAVEANLLKIYQELGVATFGAMQWTPVFINRADIDRVKRDLGLDATPYPYPSGSWTDYINYCQTSTNVKRAGYHKSYGYLTLVNYWLEKQESNGETPDLWKTSEQPITAVKDAVSLLLAYIQEVQADDRVGLSAYTHPVGGASLEMPLTDDMDAVEQSSRLKQAGHYTSYTNISAGLQVARTELEDHGRPGAFKMIVLLTDGQANRPSGSAVERTIEEAELCAQRRYPVVAVSLGAGADQELMQQIADITGGVHFNVPGGGSVAEYEEDLKDVFRQIAAHRPVKLVQ